LLELFLVDDAFDGDGEGNGSLLDGGRSLLELFLVDDAFDGDGEGNGSLLDGGRSLLELFLVDDVFDGDGEGGSLLDRRRSLLLLELFLVDRDFDGDGEGNGFAFAFDSFSDDDTKPVKMAAVDLFAAALSARLRRFGVGLSSFEQSKRLGRSPVDCPLDNIASTDFFGTVLGGESGGLSKFVEGLVFGDEFSFLSEQQDVALAEGKHCITRLLSSRASAIVSQG
jgi:hypothetical protein